MNHLKKKIYIRNEYFDLETGEVITKSLRDREYILSKNKINKVTSYEDCGAYLIKTIKHGCRKHKQGTLF